jgi:hypothetical protein
MQFTGSDDEAGPFQWARAYLPFSLAHQGRRPESSVTGTWAPRGAPFLFVQGSEKFPDVLMAVTAFSDRTVAVTQTRTEAHNAAVYYVAVPAGIKAFPVDLVPLP